jgi:hypothetical protein
MGTLLVTFHDAGFLAWILLGAAALGGLASIAGLVAVAFRARATYALGIVATAIGILCAGLGGLGVVQARIATDAHVNGEGQRPVERQRLRRDGYLLARAPARLGLLCAVQPLLVGVALLFIAARRKAALSAPDPDLPLASRAPFRVPLGAATVGVLSAGFALAALNDPVPGRNFRADETARKLLDQLEDVRHTTDPDVLVDACRAVEDAITAGQAMFDPGRLPTLPAAARRCVEDRVQRAAVLSSLGAVRGDLEAVARSPFAQRDPELAALVAVNLEEVRRISREDSARALETSPVSQVRTGRVYAAGEVPGEVVERAVRKNIGRFRLCYEHALRNDLTVQGHVDVRFTIERDGSVAAPVSIGSDVRDAGMVACVVQHFGSISFRATAPATATVLVDMRFAPPDADPLDLDDPVR